jgi:hypothetical protein
MTARHADLSCGHVFLMCVSNNSPRFFQSGVSLVCRSYSLTEIRLQQQDCGKTSESYTATALLGMVCARKSLNQYPEALMMRFCVG